MSLAGSSLEFRPSSVPHAPLDRYRGLVRHLRPGPLLARLRRSRLEMSLERRGEPASRRLGLDRGSPIDRYWIDQFIEANRDAIRGRCLEVGGDRYVRTYGTTGVAHVDVLDVDPANESASVHGDLRSLPHIADNSYDCLVLTQVLQYIDDLPAAFRECARILSPGGTILVTVPTTQALDPFAPAGRECWRFTAHALEWLTRSHFPVATIELKSWGNAGVGAAFFLGLAQQDVRQRELDKVDPMFPCLVTMRATKA